MVKMLLRIVVEIVPTYGSIKNGAILDNSTSVASRCHTALIKLVNTAFASRYALNSSLLHLVLVFPQSPSSSSFPPFFPVPLRSTKTNSAYDRGEYCLSYLLTFH